MKNLLNSSLLTEKKFQIFLLIYVIFAPLSYHLLPFIGIYGSDLSMQYFYQHCSMLTANSDNLYQLTGSICHDAHNAYYAYPVLIFRFFSFAKWFQNFEIFYSIWFSLIVISILSFPFFWLKNRPQKYWYLIIGIILIIQAPSFYALERGGTDIIFIIPWMLATYMALKNKWILSTFFMSVAALFKLYPVMAIAPIILGIFYENKKSFKFLKYGMIIGVFVLVLMALDFELWKTFLVTILPHETKFTIGTNPIGHSLIGPFPKIFVYPLMFYFWNQFAKVFSLNEGLYKKLVFAAVLAMSTYFNGHSFDYNLITTFPLILMIIELYFDKESPMKHNQLLMWAIIILTLTILGPANFVFGPFKFIVRIKLLLELLGFALIPYSILKQNDCTKLNPE